MAEEHHETLLQIAGKIFETAQEKVTAAVATGAILSPFVTPSLKEISETAALLAPILGCLWLVLQIVLKLLEFARPSKRQS